MKITCIIQARTSSSRLPNKVLLKLPYNDSKSVLEQVIFRIKQSEYINEIIVATTSNKTDNLIENLCSKIGIKVYRGSEDDVLARYYEAAKLSRADIVIRITSDCPCIDYKVLNKLIEKHLSEKNDYTSNTLIRSYPHGLDCEIFSFKALNEAYLYGKDKFEREHVTPYIYKTAKNNYKIGVLELQENLSNIRVTLDTKEDYNLLCAVYDFLYEKNNLFEMGDLKELFFNKKWLFNLNSCIEQKKVCKDLNEEIKEAIKLLNKQDLNKAEIYLKEKFYEKK
ncbi:MAG: cytidylyltransferase domain-containing protein [Cetobacterium sp.]